MRVMPPAPVPQRKKHRELKTAILPILGGTPVVKAAQELPPQYILEVVDEAAAGRAESVKII